MPALTGYSQAFHSDSSGTASTRQVSLGTRAVDTNGNEYVYAKGTASVTTDTWVTFDEGWNVTRAVANGQGRVGIAMSDNPLSSFGWYQVYGQGRGNVLASFADNGKIFLTSTDGSVDDADVGGDFVVGAIGRSAVASGSATIELNYPIVQDVAMD